MREIEFRGIATNSNEWLYGFYNGFPKEPYITRDPGPHADTYELFQVYPETVGQYTGLKDKNGVKIFEGDILSWGYYKRICQVKWMDDTARFLYITADQKLIYPGEAKACEVIGNIHDDPKILEDEE